MAQTNYTPIQLYYSTTASAVPVNTNLASGELAININDGILFYKDNGGTVQKIGYKLTPTTAGGTGLTSFTANGLVYASSTSALATGSALTFDGTNLGLGGTTNSYGSQTTMTLSGTNVSRIDFRSNSVFTGTILSYQAVTEGLRLQTEAGYPITFFPAGTEAMRIGVATGGVGAVGIGYTSLTSVGDNGLAVLGNVGIGTSSPKIELQVESSGGIQAVNSNEIALRYNAYYDGADRYIQAANKASSIVLDSNGSILFYNTNTASTSANSTITGWTQRAIIDSSGNLGIGTTSTTAVRLIVKGSTTNGTTNALKLIDSADADILAMSTAGDFYLPKMGSSTGTTVVLTSGNYLVKSSSSIRYKKDVEPIDIGLNFILGLNPVKYKLKEDDIDQVGFIAEDFPDARLVSESMIDPQDKTKGFQREGVLYAQIVAPLVKAIQEQQAIITQLTARITALEGA